MCSLHPKLFFKFYPFRILTKGVYFQHSDMAFTVEAEILPDWMELYIRDITRNMHRRIAIDGTKKLLSSLAVL